MPIGAIIAIVIICVIVAAVAAVAGIRFSRRQALRRRFGAEYDRLAREVGPGQAETELTERQRLVEQLGIRPLTPEQQARYEGEWAAAQERFVEEPAQATRAAATLVIDVARDRGYSAGDAAKLLKELSVVYPFELEGYRRALDAAARLPEATTEELREAVIGYRAMFRGLLEPSNGAAGGAPEPVSTTPARVGADSGAGARQPAADATKGRP